MKRNSLSILATVILVLLTASANGHAVAYDFSSMTTREIGLTYLRLGFLHILPFGLDHVLFVLGLFFLDPRMKAVIGQATAFTVAHSVTLGLAMTGRIQPAANIIEPVIALSILFLALENIFFRNVRWWRIAIVFIFGLIHGCGFASVLAEAGLPEGNYALALVTFNAGIELGQLAVILLAWGLVGKWFYGKAWYRRRIVIPVSAGIGCVALFWTVERVLQ
jgi:hypothetical protein